MPAADLTGGTGLRENVAALLCYALCWLTGIAFLLIDKRPFVRFHALQSVIVFGILHVVQGSAMWGVAEIVSGRVVAALGGLLWLLTLVLWIICMVKAYQGERFKLPIAGDMAENASK